MISDCGIGGIAGYGAIDHSLIEDNLIENICGRDAEHICDTAGIKFHVTDSVLIRRNVIRHIRKAPGVWLDYMCRNSRVTGNILADIEAVAGGIYLEVDHFPNMVDHNLLWDIRSTEGRPAVHADTGEDSIIAHNLFGRIRNGYAVGADLMENDRLVDGRVGLCFGHRVLNNVFIDCPKRIFLTRADGNTSDGNLFDQRDDEASLCVELPWPKSILNLAGWQAFYRLDMRSMQGKISAEFDPDALQLTLNVGCRLPSPVEIPELTGEADETVGPFTLTAGEQTLRFSAGARRMADPATIRPENVWADSHG